MMMLFLVCPGRCRLGPCSKVKISTVSPLYINIRPWRAPAVCVSYYLPNDRGAVYIMLIIRLSPPQRASTGLMQCYGRRSQRYGAFQTGPRAIIPVIFLIHVARSLRRETSRVPPGTYSVLVDAGSRERTWVRSLC